MMMMIIALKLQIRSSKHQRSDVKIVGLLCGFLLSAALEKCRHMQRLYAPPLALAEHRFIFFVVDFLLDSVSPVLLFRFFRRFYFFS